MNIAIALIVAVALCALALWAIGALAPADLQYPLRVIVIVAFLVWVIWLLWPVVAGLARP